MKENLVSQRLDNRMSTTFSLFSVERNLTPVPVHDKGGRSGDGRRWLSFDRVCDLTSLLVPEVSILFHFFWPVNPVPRTSTGPDQSKGYLERLTTLVHTGSVTFGRFFWDVWHPLRSHGVRPPETGVPSDASSFGLRGSPPDNTRPGLSVLFVFSFPTPRILLLESHFSTLFFFPFTVTCKGYCQFRDHNPLWLGQVACLLLYPVVHWPRRLVEGLFLDVPLDRIQWLGGTVDKQNLSTPTQ